MIRTRRGILYVSAIIVLVAPPAVWVLSRLPAARHSPVTPSLAYADASRVVPTQIQPQPADELLALAQRDPLGLVRRAHEKFNREVSDYRCMLAKQELLDGELSEVQEIEVRIRKSPLSIYMLWQQNAGDAKRALFKDDPEFVDSDGNLLARVEPAGSIVRLFVTDVFVPVKGERAEKASRRTIDECGFDTTFRLMERYCSQAREAGVLELDFAGTAEIDGRPTLVLVRHLPYKGDGGTYPDAKLVLHLDREWLLPVAVESFADRAGTRLLGRYVFTKVQLNPGLKDADFQF